MFKCICDLFIENCSANVRKLKFFDSLILIIFIFSSKFNILHLVLFIINELTN